jgi:transcriptional regulator with XRE-family HTH domain
LITIQAERIRERRKQLGLSQEDIPATHLREIARALNVSADWLLGLTDELEEAQAHKLDKLELLAIKFLRQKQANRKKAIVHILKLTE